MLDDNMAPCNWTGVECDLLGQLIGVDMSSRGIQGGIQLAAECTTCLA